MKTAVLTHLQLQSADDQLDGLEDLFFNPTEIQCSFSHIIQQHITSDITHVFRALLSNNLHGGINHFSMWVDVESQRTLPQLTPEYKTKQFLTAKLLFLHFALLPLVFGCSGRLLISFLGLSLVRVTVFLSHSHCRLLFSIHISTHKEREQFILKW